MDTRKEQLLSSIIEEYIRTSEPVGSKALAGSRVLAVSPATIRNEMADLERLGFITHPHTSAGRIPTVKGYKYYIENFLAKQSIAKKDRESLRQALDSDPEITIKNVAKGVADISNLGTFVAFSQHNVFYTGISHLFSHPEFRDYDYSYAMTEIIDQLEESIAKVFRLAKDRPTVLLGEDNPFGEDCAAVVVSFGKIKDESKLLGVFGPVRMDYQKTISTVEYAKDLIHEQV